jgi:hypothetical protein
MATLLDKCSCLSEPVADVYPHGHDPDPATAIVNTDADAERERGQWVVRFAGYFGRGDAYCWMPIP